MITDHGGRLSRGAATDEQERAPMRIVVIEFMSLDGVVQAPGGPEEDTDGGFAHGGWSHPFFDPEVVGGAFDDALSKAEALLYGRRTWQTMAAAWPERAGDPFADRMNSIPKYVVSSTLRDDELTWSNTTRIPGDGAVARIRELHDGGRGDLLVMGSPTLVRTLLGEGLVDELRLMIEPVILGGGKTIFPGDSALRTLELTSTATSGAGVVVCTYRPAANG
jgi:dihydrofolate reductase